MYIRSCNQRVYQCGSIFYRHPCVTRPNSNSHIPTQKIKLQAGVCCSHPFFCAFYSKQSDPMSNFIFREKNQTRSVTSAGDFCTTNSACRVAKQNKEKLVNPIFSWLRNFFPLFSSSEVGKNSNSMEFPSKALTSETSKIIGKSVGDHLPCMDSKAFQTGLFNVIEIISSRVQIV